jgi:PKD repeat protein
MTSVVVVGVLLTASVATVGSAKAVETLTARRARGQQLALDLMTEILQHSYADTVNAPLFGREGSESATSRALYNDVDDYNGWTESPPQFKNDSVMPDLSGWTRSVLVEWADPTTLAATNTTNTGVKRITVTVVRSGKVVASMIGYRTVAWVESMPTASDTANHPPVAIATGTPLTARTKLVTTLSGSKSTDSDSDSLSYSWNFGDGTTGSGVSVSHTYNTVGTYTITLIVYDGRGGVSTNTLTATVTP